MRTVNAHCLPQASVLSVVTHLPSLIHSEAAFMGISLHALGDALTTLF